MLNSLEANSPDKIANLFRKLGYNAIEALVQKCLDAKGQGVEQWEAEIDDRVAHLYDI